MQWFLNHPNLVKLYDFFDDRHNIYLFLELGSDGHLFDLMERKGTFSEESVAIIIREVIRGVQHMHSHSILHRDIKPENIVMTHVILYLFREWPRYVISDGQSMNQDSSERPYAALLFISLLRY